MINSHKELIGEIENFANKFELINDFRYIKDISKLIEEVEDSKPRVLVVGLSDMELDEANYNVILTYKFIISDSTEYSDAEVMTSEDENIFTVSALADYLNHIKDAPIDISGLSMTTEYFNDTSYTSLSGQFSFTIKRTASYWKHMEQYSQ
jgi:hypothetical protein